MFTVLLIRLTDLLNSNLSVNFKKAKYLLRLLSLFLLYYSLCGPFFFKKKKLSNANLGT